MSNKASQFPDPPISSIDEEGLMVPPWIKFPNIPVGSIGWRMGIGESYKCEEFPKWWSGQPRSMRIRVKEKYPSPESWGSYFKDVS